MVQIITKRQAMYKEIEIENNLVTLIKDFRPN